jgi:2-oxoglutarate dehydrogenase E2 component (dihydrolipoamide succinyltransferase)
VDDVAIPKLNSTDDSYVLVEWLVADGAQVSAGDDLALIETSKAVTELTAPGAGRVSQQVAAMSVCRPGEVVAYLAVSAAERTEPSSASVQPARAGETPPELVLGKHLVLTGPARELLTAHGLSEDAVQDLGKTLIRKSDVEAILAGAAPASGRVAALPPGQRAVARAVTRSHASIPAAFTVLKMPVDVVLRRQDDASAQARSFIGIPEFLVEAVAQASADFPDCLATVGDDLSITPADSVDIGVTIDVGTGLYVPVIRAADRLDPAAIAAQLMRYRLRAMRGRMTERDLAGARLTISLHQLPGIVLAEPIIFPGQVCTLSLAAQQRELVLDQAGQVAERSYCYLGMSYDHRVINGRQAADFLAAVSDRMQR